MTSSQVIRIFISSPGDVADEREKAREVVRSLERHFRDVTLEPVLWEELALPATASFQETIDYLLNREPIDIAVFILWSRLGSPLGPALRRPDGSPYRSGTEREFDLMLTAFQQSQAGRPVILAYTRKDEDGFRNLIASADGQRMEELFAQRKLAESFIQEQFHDQQGRNLRAYHVYREPVSFAQRLKTHLKQAIEELIGSDAAPRWLDEPYRGLRYFEQAHAPIFRGREAETDALLERLDDQQAAGCAFVVVLGASGSGKSSLARAGAAAALTQRVWDERVRQWRVAVFIPGLASQPEQPADAPGFLIRALVELLAVQVPELTAGIQPADLAAGLERDPEMTIRLSIAPAFVRAAEQAQGAVRGLLILDQMEELWTDRRISAADRSRFLSAIHALARSGQVAVLATLRSDFYAAAQSEPVFLALKGDRGLFDLLPPDAAALRRLISEPARLAGLQFEQDAAGRGLDEVILEAAVRDVSRDPGALPLLQYALSELNARRDPAQRVLTFAAWEATGGIDGALGRRADELFQQLPAGAQAALPDLLPQLVTVDNDGEQSAVRRRAAMHELAGTPDRQLLLTRLIEARFLTAETDPQTGQAVVSLAHEALLRRWPRVADWVHANRDALRLRARVELSQQRWEQQPETSLLLPPGLPLEEGRQLLTTAPHILRKSTVCYVQTSLDHQAALSHRTRRRRQAVLTILTLLTLTAGLASLFAWRKSRELMEKNEQLDATLSQTHYFLADARFNENKIDEAFELLDRMPEKHRNFEWFLTRRLYDVSIMTLYGHSSNIHLIAWSPDRRQIASAGMNGAIIVWDAVTGFERRTLSGHSEDVTSIAFSRDGTLLASGGRDRKIKVWDAASYSELKTLSGHSESVSCVAFSPDGTHLASGSHDKTIKVWNADTGAEIRTLTGHSDWVLSVAFSPDGTHLASGSHDKTIKVWDVATGADIRTLAGHSEDVKSVVFSPDGTRIATGSQDKTIKVWDAATGAEMRMLTGHLWGVSSVAFSPDGTRIATGSDDKTIKVWNAATGVELRTLTGHSKGVTSLAFSPDGTRIATGSDDKTIKVWNAATGVELRTLTGHSKGVTSLAFSSDGTRIATGSDDKTIKLWDAATGAELRTLTGHSNSLWVVAFSPDGTRLASGSGDDKLKVWDAATGAELRTLTGHTEPVTSVAFSPDGTRLASGSLDKTIKVWDPATGGEMRMLTGHSWGVHCVAFSPDGTRLVSGSEDKTIKVWDATTSAEMRTLTGHSDWVHCVAFSPDGTRLVSGSEDKTIKMWDATTSAELRTLTGHSEPVTSVAFSPDGTRIASASHDKTIKVWDAATGTKLRTLTMDLDWGQSVAFSPEGTRLFSLELGGAKRAWDVRTGEPAPLPEVWADDASQRQRSSDGKWLAVPSGKYVRLVDLEFKNTPREKARREHAARIDPVRHREAAEEAMKAEDWYAATFHYAWALTAKPDDAEAREALRDAYGRWRKQREEERLASKEPAEPPPGEKWLFPLAVRKALELAEAPPSK